MDLTEQTSRLQQLREQRACWDLAVEILERDNWPESPDLARQLTLLTFIPMNHGADEPSSICDHLPSDAAPAHLLNLAGMQYARGYLAEAAYTYQRAQTLNESLAPSADSAATPEL